MSSAPTFEVGQMFFYKLGDGVSLVAGERGARVMNLGGETLGGSRYIWWNFVASWKESIEAARGAWRAGDWRTAA